MQEAAERKNIQYSLQANNLKTKGQNMRAVTMTSLTLLIISLVLTSTREAWDTVNGDMGSGFLPDTSKRLIFLLYDLTGVWEDRGHFPLQKRSQCQMPLKNVKVKKDEDRECSQTLVW